MANDKDTIYIDIDDEITGIIDKVQGSPGKVVALVLPKRAAVFQSIVNMKLLKRAADSSGKNVALITTEAGLLPLAGVAGIHVAKTLNSKPEIPLAPKLNEDVEESVDEDGELTAAAGGKAIGDLADKPPADGGVETLTLDDDTLPADSPAGPPTPKSFDPPAKGKGAKGKNKKFKIPDFDRFRLLLVGGILLLIALIVFMVLAIKVLPKATITVDTDSQSIDSNLSLNLSTAAKKLDAESGTIPAKAVQQQKVYSQQVATTGQKNNGNKASGSVVLTNCSGSDVTIPSGTGLSSGGNTYISQQTVTVPDSSYSKQGSCHNNGKATVTIIAQNPGSAYNGATNFTVAGQSDMTGSPASSISGGTDNIVHSVNQNDINNAKAKINTNDPNVKKSLQDQLEKDGYYVIRATYSPGTPATSQSANVGAVADNVTVTETVTYTLFGVRKDDLRKLVEDDVSGQIDTNKQKVQDDGIDDATFNVENQSATGAQVTMATKAIAGPDIDIESIRKEAIGQKPGKIKDDLEGNPGIKEVDVDLSPFWVSSVPNKPDKVHVVIAKPKNAADRN
ncbi:MAG TPA: hypothetical protein VD706_02370 [Candidatus Saccharimonadales bacterium]|nr:hypothetical protein [Candidatus Saccharimonadales bacterium]